LAALVVALPLLAACIPADPSHAPAPEPAPAPPVASLDMVRIEPAARPPTVPSVASPIRDEREADGPPVGPEFLVGLDRTALQRAIGTPTLRRREARAEVWQYQADACVMDAFLYATPESEGVPRVTYVELRRNGVAILTDPEERRACYADAVAEGKRNAALDGAEP
jgi:hypothetical protein